MAALKNIWSLCKPALPFVAACLAVALLSSQPLRELRASVGPRPTTYAFQFPLSQQDGLASRIHTEGFIPVPNALVLAPGSSGSITITLAKQPGEACSLRVWLYGSSEYPSRLLVSADNGTTFTLVTENSNQLGTYFDVSPLVQQSSTLVVRLTAENHAAYETTIVNRLETHLGAGPGLPGLAGACAVFLLCYFIVYAGMHRSRGLQHLCCRAVLCCIVFAAFALRWNMVVQSAGAPLVGDCEDYLRIARAMQLFSDTGFFSASFGYREPLYPFLAKILLLPLGLSETHLRFVSLFFSVGVVVLCWCVGKAWFNELTGLLAAGIIAIHPFLIDLSCRGFREELFTCLVLLLVYLLGRAPRKTLSGRTLCAGLVVGATLLTRTESLIMLAAILACAVLFGKEKWSWQQAALALTLGILLLAPYSYNTWLKRGTPFYAINMHTRFYANQEFAGQPGFPTKEEIARKNIYVGPTITPFEYYFKLHSFQEVLRRSSVGFLKTACALPLSFAEGKGNLRKLYYGLLCVKERGSFAACQASLQWLHEVTVKDGVDYVLALCLVILLIASLPLLAYRREFFFCCCFVLIQLQTAFLAGFILEPRLTAHVYPVVALCCAAVPYLIAKKTAARS